jgi:co-chaperonin GroES (HSP10)
MTAHNDQIIVKQVEEQEQMSGNIIIPDMDKVTANRYEVIKVGPGAFNTTKGEGYIPINLQVGDEVLIPKAVVYKFITEEGEFGSCREVDVKVILNR